MAKFSLYVHKGGLKPDSFHFFYLFHQSDEVISPQKYSISYTNIPDTRQSILQSFAEISVFFLDRDEFSPT